MGSTYFEIRSYDANTKTPIRFGCFDNYQDAEKAIWNLPNGKYEIKKVFNVKK